MVSSEDGLPMTGVAILDKQSSNGVMTDMDGKFSIQVSPRTKSLNVSYLGYKAVDIRIEGTTMKITMEPDLVALDEVMVVAYGTGKKSSFTGSATVVKSDALEKIKASNVTQALQGQSSGVQVLNTSGEPGSDATIMIRGIGSMNASSSPLYVVDGTAYDGYLNAINPADIESMTVLKDASATALYGSRAANGVVMITTKKGASEKGQLNFRSSWGWSSLAVDLPRTLTPDEFAVLTWQALSNGYMDNGYSQSDAANYASSYLVGQWGCNPYNVDMPVGLDGKMNPDAQLLYSGDWRDALMKSRLRQEYNIDFSGKSKKADYYLSAGYLNDKGVFTVSEFERFTVRANVNYEVNKWLKVGLNANLAHGLKEGSSNDQVVWMLRSMPSVYPIYEWDAQAGDYARDSDGNLIYDYGDYRTSWSGSNFVADNVYNKYPYTTDNASARTYFEINFLPGLKWRTNFNFDYYLYGYDGYTNSEYGFAAGYGGEAYKQNDKNFSWTANHLLTYDKTIGDHSFSILLGQEAYYRQFKSLQAAKRGLPFFGITEIGAASEMSSMNSYTDNYRLLSWFSRAEYDYNDRYYLSASFRTDGSSRFAPESRWGKFWSVGASWKIMQEEFMKDTSDWLSNLSLRASYGAQGNDQVGYYAYQALYSIRNNLGESGLHAYRLATPNLSWETNLNTNIGLDFGFWNNRLNGTIEYFERRSKDLLFSKDLVPSSGFSSMDENIGAIKNYGWEFQISGYPIMTKDWKWKLSFNATTYKNKITSLPAEEMWSGNKKWVKGGSLYDFYLVEWAGVNPENGNPMWYRYNTNGEKVTTEDYSSTTPDDKVKCGNSLPDWTGGLQSDLSFKDFTLSFLFSYSIGGKIYNGDKVSLMSQGPTGTGWSVDMLDRWTPENPYTDVPRLTTSPKSSWTNSSNRFLVDRSYLRLKNITFSYNLPKSLLNTLTLKDASIFFQAENMLTLAKQQGLDPEQTFGGSTYYRYPAMKTISFGINVKL